MDRVLSICREVINSERLILGKIKSRKTNKWIPYVSGDVFYSVVCKMYDEKYGVDQKEPYLENRYELFKVIRKAYKTHIKTFSANKGRYGTLRVYYFEDLKRILNQEPKVPKTRKPKNNYNSHTIIIEKLHKIIKLLENIDQKL